MVSRPSQIIRILCNLIQSKIKLRIIGIKMIKVLKRFIKIIAVFIYYGLDQALLPKILSPSILLKLFSRYALIQKKPLGERLSLALSDLGPLLIKFGQLVSIRHDLFPESITKPLRSLQDNVSPFDSDEAILMIESSCGHCIDDLFLSFNPKPIASASIAQVHLAQLKDKTMVAVKIIRPGIRDIVPLDIKILTVLVYCLAVIKRWDRRALQGMVNEYAYTLEQELCLHKEGSHYSHMRYLFEQDNRLYVPKVYWQYTNNNILTIEYINALPIDSLNKLSEAHRKKLAYDGVSIFFTQVFKHRFFHADMHPGNVLILMSDPPQYAAVDFGIVGNLSKHDHYYLAESFLAFHQRNYTRIAELYIEAGWVDKETAVIQFESSIRHVCEPIFSKKIEDISIAELMHQVVEASKSFNVHLQPQLLLLQKTLFQVEALGRMLYPKLNLWEASEPFIKEFMQERVSYRKGLHHLKSELPRLLEIAPKLPYLLQEHLQPKPSPQLIYPLNILIGMIIGILFAQCIR